jgi:cysteinyl-tRNA synthetase
MEKAIDYDGMLNKFYLDVETHLNLSEQLDDSNTNTKFDEHDLTLNEYFSTTKNQIHLALCDSIDTPSVMENIRQLTSTTNIYMKTADSIQL